MAPPQTPGPPAEQGNPELDDSRSEVFQSWVLKDGRAKYAQFKKEPTYPDLTYQEWLASAYAIGSFLFSYTLAIWNEESSDDDEPEEPEEPIEAAPSVPAELGQAETVQTNANGIIPAVESPAPAVVENTRELVTLPKKRQRAKKSYLSKAIIASEDEEDSAATVAEAQEAATTSNKKPKTKKTPQSAPLTPATKNAQSTPTAVADVRDPTVATASPDGPATSSATRKGLRTRTPAQQRPYFHHAKLFEEQVKAAPQVEAIKNKSPRLTLVQSPQVPTKLAQVSNAAEERVSEDDFDVDAELDDEPEEKPVAPKKFKGKGRAWKKDNEDEDDDFDVASAVPKKPKKKLGRPRKSLPSTAPVVQDVQATPSAPSVSNVQPTKELEAAVNGDARLEMQAALPSQNSPKSPKAQRKQKKKTTPIQEDIEKSVSLQANSSPRLKLTQSPSPNTEKKPRKPRRSYLSAEFVRSDSSTEEVIEEAKVTEAPKPTSNGTAFPVETAHEKAQRKKRKSRKSHLSEEFVRDTDTEVEESQKTIEREMTPPPAKETPNGDLKNGGAEHGSPLAIPTPSSAKKSSASRGKAKKSAEPATNGAASPHKENGEVQQRESQSVPSPSTPLRKGGKKRMPGSV